MWKLIEYLIAIIILSTSALAIYSLSKVLMYFSYINSRKLTKILHTLENLYLFIMFYTSVFFTYICNNVLNIFDQCISSI
jgi:hypothetical protein